MHDIGEGTIRKIDWQELTPVVLLLRVFQNTFALRPLLLALIGLLLSECVLWYLPQNFSRTVDSVQGFHHTIVSAELLIGSSAGEQLRGTLFLPPYFHYQTFSYFHEHQPPYPYSAYIWLVANALIWFPIITLVMRCAAVRLTIDERESCGTLLLFLKERILGMLNAVVLLGIGVVLCLVPVKIAGWLAALPYINYGVAVFLPVPILFALFAVILLSGICFGFPLLFSAVCVDGSDGFDAISRTFSYLYQRPLHYVFYWLCSGILGYIGYLIVLLFSILVSFVIDMHIGSFRFAAFPAFFGNLWLSALTAFPAAYAVVWFWTSCTAIYMLLRRSVDATPFDEVYRVKETEVKKLPHRSA